MDRWRFAYSLSFSGKLRVHGSKYVVTPTSRPEVYRINYLLEFQCGHCACMIRRSVEVV